MPALTRGIADGATPAFGDSFGANSWFGFLSRIFVNIIDHHRDQTQTQDEDYKGPKADHPPLAKRDADTAANETVVVLVVFVTFWLFANIVV